MARSERLSLLLLVSRPKAWTYLLLFLQPHTPRRWHRQGFMLFWSLHDRNSFPKNHAQDVWACGLLLVIYLSFRTIIVFFIIGLGSRRVVQFGVTRHPADAWVARQMQSHTL